MRTGLTVALSFVGTAVGLPAVLLAQGPTFDCSRGDRTVTLWRVGAAGEGKYEGQNVSLVHKGDGLTVSWLDTNTGKTDELQCRAR
jgi:hypothetical protein